MTVTRTIPTILRQLSLFIFLFILLPVYSFAQQEITVKGIVIDSLERTPLDSCYISLKAAKDEWRTYSGEKGSFSFKGNFTSDTLLLSITRRNFQPAVLKITIKNNLADAGTILLTPASKLLEDIVIRARTPPILIKNDTTEYTIDSFEKKKGAMIGSVLKDLPGFEIDDEGRITHNGKPVSRILVNGEEFFGGDRNISLNNLPADLVSKLQVMDTKTKEQIFSGLQSDGEDKTINIKLKPGLQAFGNASASAGTQGQLNANLMGNVLRDKKHIGLLGSTNSNRKTGFNKDNEGLKNIMQNAGLHYRDKLGKKLGVNGSTTLMNNRSEQETIRQGQQYFRADSFFINNSYNYTNYKSLNHQANLTLEFEDKKFLGTLTMMYAGGSNQSANNSSSAMIENAGLKNKSQRDAIADGGSTSFNSNLSLNRRFNKKGRTLSFTFRSAYWKNNADNLNNAHNSFYEHGTFLKEDILRQHILMDGVNQSMSFGVNYIEPINKKLRLQLSQNFDFSNAENKRNTYNIDSSTKEDVFDSTYSDLWRSRYGKNNSSVSLIYELKELYLTTGISVYRNDAERRMGNNEVIRQDQQNISPNLVANYRISKTKSLRFNFSGTFQNPSIDQLQPVPDNSNPMYIRLGNPALRPAFQQTFNLGYTGSYVKGKTMSFSLGYSPTINSIINASYYDALRRRISQYVNVDGVFGLRSNWNFSKVINGPSKAGSSWGLNGSGGYGRSVFFDKTAMVYTKNFNIRQNFNYSRLMIKGRQRTRLTGSMAVNYNRMTAPSNSSGINSRSFSLLPKLDWNYRLREFIEITSSYGVNYSRLNYGNTSGKTNYTDHVFNSNVDLDLSDRISMETSLGYRFNGRLPDGTPNKQQWLWNLTGSLSMFKNQRGTLSLSAFDILNNSAEINRTITDYYIEDVQMARQRGYFILSFQYNWTKMNKKKEKIAS